MDFIDTKDFEHGGRWFRMWVEVDDMNEPPWQQEDGHGPVSEWTTRDKRPGELVLNSDRGSHRYYDFQEACRIALKEGWAAGATKEGTVRDAAAQAARADFERLRAWCNDEWRYVGVVVAPICPCCGEAKHDYRHALWSIESDAGDYLDTVAHELADEVEPITGCQQDKAV